MDSSPFVPCRVEVMLRWGFCGLCLSHFFFGNKFVYFTVFAYDSSLDIAVCCKLLRVLAEIHPFSTAIVLAIMDRDPFCFYSLFSHGLMRVTFPYSVTIMVTLPSSVATTDYAMRSRIGGHAMKSLP